MYVYDVTKIAFFAKDFQVLCLFSLQLYSGITIMRFLIQFFILRFSIQALIDIKLNKINETLREQWRPKSMRTLNFLSPNFIPDENKHQMDIQREYIWTSKMLNVQFPYAIFGFDVCQHSSQITPYYLKLYFAVDVFL